MKRKTWKSPVEVALSTPHAPTVLTLSHFLHGLEKVKATLGVKHPFLAPEDVDWIRCRLQESIESGARYDTYEALFSEESCLFDSDPETLPGMLIAVLAAQHVLTAESIRLQRFAELDLRTGFPFKQAKVMSGDIVVDGNLYFDNRLVIIGNLTVGGVIEAAEDHSPLFVAGDVRARGINCYRWGCSAIAGGEVHADEALAIGKNLAAGRFVRAKILFEGEGFWRIDAAIETGFHFSHEQIQEGAEGSLGEIFNPEILAPDPTSADDHAFIHQLFDALRRGRRIRR